MKLDLTFSKTAMLGTITLFTLLATGCQRASTLERFAQQVQTATNLQFKGVVKAGDKSFPIQSYRQKPNKFLVVSEQYRALTSETDGYLEIDLDGKQYLQTDWLNEFFPAVEKVCPGYMSRCLPAIGVSPLKLAPLKEWKLSKTNGHDKWHAEVVQMGNKTVYDLELDSEAKLISYGVNSYLYVAEEFDTASNISTDKFKVFIPDGSVMISQPLENMGVKLGDKLPLSSFQKGKDLAVNGRYQLFVFLDPTDGITPRMQSWISKSDPAFTKVKVELSSSGSQYFDPAGKAFWKVVSATPTMILVDKTGTVKAMWMGFDPDQTVKLDAEIHKAVIENN